MDVLTNLKMRILFSFIIALFIFIIEVNTNHKLDRCLTKIFVVKNDKYLKKTIFGDIYFEIGNYITLSVSLIPKNNDYGKAEEKFLKEIIDENTFKFIEENEMRVYFEDKSYKYTFHDVDDKFFTAQLKLK
jgi:hypothetical protein